MSAETDFRAMLASYAPLTALVGTRIALGAVPPEEALPLVVFSARHDPDYGVDGSEHIDRVSFTVQAWAQTAAQAVAVAAAIEAAIEAHDAASAGVCTWVEDRSDAYDGELGLDAQILTVVWHQ